MNIHGKTNTARRREAERKRYPMPDWGEIFARVTTQTRGGPPHRVARKHSEPRTEQPCAS